jgi:hypothetical protein
MGEVPDQAEAEVLEVHFGANLLIDFCPGCLFYLASEKIGQNADDYQQREEDDQNNFEELPNTMACLVHVLIFSKLTLPEVF